MFTLKFNTDINISNLPIELMAKENYWLWKITRSAVVAGNYI